MKGLLLISHGDFARGLYETSAMFMAGEAQYEYLCLHDTDSPDEFEAALRSAVQRLNTGDGVWILADLMAGTPANRALMLASEHPDVKLIVGMNLPLVMTILDAREDGLELDQAIESGRQGLALWSPQEPAGEEADFF